ncbi:MAG TPA: PD-(D/E)XK nuclease family protein, partial [Solirubrobacteraceae bacterium]|nr:PD-(D/E)XK nuclease family protein [Solirubrobacteraceae bacterium]
RLTPASLGRARELLALALEQNEPQFELSAAPERRPGARRRLRADLERFLEHAACAPEGPGEALEPTYLELEFGFDAEPAGADAEDPVPPPLPAFDLGDGVLLRGRVDRVDLGGGGQAVVYDYKGRNVLPAAKWIADGELQVALYMCAVERLLGVRAVGGFYQPLSGSDLRPRGVLESDAGVALESVGDDARGGAEVRALLEEALGVARAAAAQAARGELEPRPRTCGFKGGCQYPAICRCQP